MGQGVRATTRAWTRAAPADASRRAISSIVLPLVITSSTTSTSPAAHVAGDRERAADIAAAVIQRERLLRRGVPDAADELRRQATRRCLRRRPAQSASDWLKPRSDMRSNASGTGMTRMSSWTGARCGQQAAKGRGEFEARPEFQRHDHAVHRRRVVGQRSRPVEIRRRRQAPPADASAPCNGIAQTSHRRRSPGKKSASHAAQIGPRRERSTPTQERPEEAGEERHAERRSRSRGDARIAGRCLYWPAHGSRPRHFRAAPDIDGPVRGCRHEWQRCAGSSTCVPAGSSSTTRWCARSAVAWSSGCSTYGWRRRRVLDVGCGAGRAMASLSASLPVRAGRSGLDLSEVHAADSATAGCAVDCHAGSAARSALLVAADAARLPMVDDSVDLVFSNLMLHWHPEPHTLFPEWKRVLRVDGLVALRVLRSRHAEGTSRRLPQRRCRRHRPMPFIDMHDFGDMMVASGLANPVMDAEVLTLTYRSARDLLAEVRALGGNPRDDRLGGLPSGRQARSLLDALNAQAGDDGRIRLTFEVAYGHAWKAGAAVSKRRAVSRRRAACATLRRRRQDAALSAGATNHHFAEVAMGLISFFKEAGEKLFGKKVQEAQAAPGEGRSRRAGRGEPRGGRARSRTTSTRWGSL